jgi:hypothetical protein
LARWLCDGTADRGFYDVNASVEAQGESDGVRGAGVHLDFLFALLDVKLGVVGRVPEVVDDNPIYGGSEATEYVVDEVVRHRPIRPRVFELQDDGLCLIRPDQDRQLAFAVGKKNETRDVSRVVGCEHAFDADFDELTHLAGRAIGHLPFIWEEGRWLVQILVTVRSFRFLRHAYKIPLISIGRGLLGARPHKGAGRPQLLCDDFRPKPASSTRRSQGTPHCPAIASGV